MPPGAWKKWNRSSPPLCEASKSYQATLTRSPACISHKNSAACDGRPVIRHAASSKSRRRKRNRGASNRSPAELPCVIFGKQLPAPAASISTTIATVSATAAAPTAATGSTSTTAAGPSTATAGPSSASATAFAGGTRFVDDNITAHEILAVQRLYGAVGLFVAVDLDKSEPARLPRKTVAHQSDICRSDSRLRKQCIDLLFCSLEREITDVEFLQCKTPSGRGDVDPRNLGVKRAGSKSNATSGRGPDQFDEGRASAPGESCSKFASASTKRYVLNYLFNTRI